MNAFTRFFFAIVLALLVLVVLLEIKTLLSVFDANVGSLLNKVADLVVETGFESSDQKIYLLKAIREVEYRNSIGMNEEWLLDYLIAAFCTMRSSV